MDLVTKLSVYEKTDTDTIGHILAGGPGSGCDPEAARRHGKKCGRPRKLAKRFEEWKKVTWKKPAFDKQTSREVGAAIRHEAATRNRQAKALRDEIGVDPDDELTADNAAGFLTGGYLWLADMIGEGAVAPMSVESGLKSYKEFEHRNYSKALAWMSAALVGIAIEVTFIRRLGRLMRPLTPFARQMRKAVAGPSRKMSSGLYRRMASTNRQLMQRARTSPGLRRLFRRPIRRAGGRRPRRVTEVGRFL